MRKFILKNVVIEYRHLCEFKLQITRIQNPTLYQQYVVRKQQMESASQQPNSVERVLWHGTSVDAIKSIDRDGFNRSYCGKNGW